MASKISNVTELFHRFHNCEMQLRQGKIAACLIAFKEVIERLPAIPKTEKEKNELRQGIELFLRNLSAHKKFQEIFGVVSFGDTDLETNLEFIKSMITAQEEDIVERVKKDDETAEAQRLEIDREKQKRQEEMRKKIEQSIGFIDQQNLPAAWEIMNESDEIRETVAAHYNDMGMQNRTNKSFAEAIQNYTKALIVSPDDENLHYNIGRAYFEADNPDKAEKHLANAIKLNPEFKEGQIFYDYLLKIDAPKAGSADGEKKSGGFFKKFLHRNG
jgi:tetratricopeptide (TPR) repeat protein